MLSILRIMVGLLYMEHGLAKILDFPHQPNHAPYALFTLNPGLQGLLELVGGLLLALGLFTRPVAFVLAGNMAVAYFMAHAPRGFFPLLNGGELAMSIALSSSISGSLAAANGASIGYARRRLRPPYRRAGPDHHRLRQWGRSSGSPCSERLCLLMGGGSRRPPLPRPIQPAPSTPLHVFPGLTTELLPFVPDRRRFNARRSGGTMWAGQLSIGLSWAPWLFFA
jgi:putative oxidoreductase